MSPNKNDEFDRQLAGKFDSFRPEVPSSLWDEIAAKLDEQEQTGIVLIKRRRRLPTWWISVAASALVMCGIAYWYHRPVAVTYLQTPVVHVEKERPMAEESAPSPAPAVEPLDIDRLKQLFAKRNRQAKNEKEPEMRVADTQLIDRFTEPIDSRLPIAEKAVPARQALAKKEELHTLPSTGQPIGGEAITAAVPDIQSPVVLEEEEETLLAAAQESRQPFGISNILNYVVGAVDQRDEKLVTFFNDHEGSLKLDFNFGLAKNKKKRLK